RFVVQRLAPASIAGTTGALRTGSRRVSSKRSSSRDHRDTCARRPSSRLSESRMATTDLILAPYNDPTCDLLRAQLNPGCRVKSGRLPFPGLAAAYACLPALPTPAEPYN